MCISNPREFYSVKKVLTADLDGVSALNIISERNLSLLPRIQSLDLILPGVPLSFAFFRSSALEATFKVCLKKPYTTFAPGGNLSTSSTAR